MRSGHGQFRTRRPGEFRAPAPELVAEARAAIRALEEQLQGCAPRVRAVVRFHGFTGECLAWEVVDESWRVCYLAEVPAARFQELVLGPPLLDASVDVQLRAQTALPDLRRKLQEMSLTDLPAQR